MALSTLYRWENVLRGNTTERFWKMGFVRRGRVISRDESFMWYSTSGGGLMFRRRRRCLKPIGRSIKIGKVSLNHMKQQGIAIVGRTYIHIIDMFGCWFVWRRRRERWPYTYGWALRESRTPGPKWGFSNQMCLPLSHSLNTMAN